MSSDDEPGRQFAPIRRSGRWVRLVPVLPAHTEFLFRLSTDDLIGPRWRFVGAVPSIESFQQTMSSGTLVQFIVESESARGSIGHVLAYGADLNSGIAYIACVMDPTAVGTGFAIEALELFMDYLFATFALRKLYLEVPEFNLKQFAKGYGDIIHQEGCLKGHVWYGGEYWDRHILAIYAEEFRENQNVSRRRTSRLRYSGA